MNPRVMKWGLLASGLVIIAITLSLASDQESLWIIGLLDVMAAVEFIAFGLMLERYGR